MKKVLWYSDFEMTKEEKDSLGDVEIISSRSVHIGSDLEAFIKKFDIIALTGSLDFKMHILELAGDRPVIVSIGNNVIVDSKDKVNSCRGVCVEYKFEKWSRLVKVDILYEDFIV